MMNKTGDAFRPVKKTVAIFCRIRRAVKHRPVRHDLFSLRLMSWHPAGGKKISAEVRPVAAGPFLMAMLEGLTSAAVKAPAPLIQALPDSAVFYPRVTAGPHETAPRYNQWPFKTG